jgi:hypothetical protein
MINLAQACGQDVDVTVTWFVHLFDVLDHLHSVISAIIEPAHERWHVYNCSFNKVFMRSGLCGCYRVWMNSFAFSNWLSTPAASDSESFQH